VSFICFHYYHLFVVAHKFEEFYFHCILVCYHIYVLITQQVGHEASLGDCLHLDQNNHTSEKETLHYYPKR